MQLVGLVDTKSIVHRSRYSECGRFEFSIDIINLLLFEFARDLNVKIELRNCCDDTLISFLYFVEGKKEKQDDILWCLRA